MNLWRTSQSSSLCISCRTPFRIPFENSIVVTSEAKKKWEAKIGKTAAKRIFPLFFHLKILIQVVKFSLILVTGRERGHSGLRRILQALPRGVRRDISNDATANDRANKSLFRRYKQQNRTKNNTRQYTRTDHCSILYHGRRFPFKKFLSYQHRGLRILATSLVPNIYITFSVRLFGEQ